MRSLVMPMGGVRLAEKKFGECRTVLKYSGTANANPEQLSASQEQAIDTVM
jgi:hypothetical protein